MGHRSSWHRAVVDPARGAHRAVGASCEARRSEYQRIGQDVPRRPRRARLLRRVHAWHAVHAVRPLGTKGGCRGCKVLTTSSKETHLKDNLWGEIRMALADLARQGIEMPGELAPADTLLIDSWGNHFIRGQVATKEEGFQGYHAAHKLIVGDEATSVTQGRCTRHHVADGDGRHTPAADLQPDDERHVRSEHEPQREVSKSSASRRSTRRTSLASTSPRARTLRRPSSSKTSSPKAWGRARTSGRLVSRRKFWDQGEDVLIPPGWVHGKRRSVIRSCSAPSAWASTSRRTAPPSRPSACAEATTSSTSRRSQGRACRPLHQRRPRVERDVAGAPHGA
jgi:hypothetical protein